MSLSILTIGYVLVGVVLALVSARRGASVLDALLVVLAWPLYAPLLVARPRAPAARDEPEQLACAVREALGTVREAAEGSPFATLLGPAAQSRLLQEVDRAAARMRAIDLELAGATGDHDAASARGTTAALRAESEASLRALAVSDRAAMRELVELLGALRARIVLARHAGSSSEGPSALVGELWARIEGLGEAVACAEASSGSRGARAA